MTEPQHAPFKVRQNISRAAVLSRLTSLYPQARYLEIGVCEGATFDRVPAARKVAVDPEFRFDHVAMQRDHPGTEYHQVTSDDYFASAVGEDEQFDVIYLDGLHVYEQTLRDLMNALDHLQPHGVIVIDDTRPPTYLASLPDRDNFFTVRSWLKSTDQRWMGDVFKLVYFIDTFCPGLSFSTIANNHGQTVVWRKRRAEVTPRTLGEIAALTFEQLVLTEDVLRLAPFGKIRPRLRADLGL
ncbi:MAG: class I SAM-dependent methyltransferase [Nocardioides sp.]|nr:class I SAM-dependent methyltransferase [Nocardioides sp.]